ncbi:MAG: hypothetical protein ACRCT1_08515 [Microcoleaceae cyanobacterium]
MRDRFLEAIRNQKPGFWELLHITSRFLEETRFLNSAIGFLRRKETGFLGKVNHEVEVLVKKPGFSECAIQSLEVILFDN